MYIHRLCIYVFLYMYVCNTQVVTTFRALSSRCEISMKSFIKGTKYSCLFISSSTFIFSILSILLEFFIFVLFGGGQMYCDLVDLLYFLRGLRVSYSVPYCKYRMCSRVSGSTHRICRAQCLLICTFNLQ